MRLARGLTFSWKRVIGITAARQRLARKLGIPTTRNGIERKVGASVIKFAMGLFR